MQSVLAQYTIRSKQEYIFRTNKIVEIVGASVNIRDAWTKLFKCADKLNMKYELSTNNDYNDEIVRDKFEKNELSFVELFCGGGNETILYKDKDTYIRLNQVFSKQLLLECPGMVPMAVCVTATDNYDDDYKRLMSKSEIEKNKMYPGQNEFILPFSMIDRDTYKPYTRIVNNEKYSEESYTKREIGVKERDEEGSIKILDDIVTKKGFESLLAVVHADGNNMGSKIMDMLDGKTSYDDCVNLMREFTKETARVFGEIGISAIKEKQAELKKKNIKEEKTAFRIIIKDGDDMTFVCNARYVFEYVSAYINAVQNYKSKWNYSSCAGVCIFHSHYPFARAYELAEQACDAAKTKVHRSFSGNISNSVDEGWIDFHYIHSGIGGNLEEIRERHNTKNKIARPWIVSGNNSTCYKFENLYKLHKIFVIDNRIARSVIKEIGVSFEESTEAGIKELRRLYNKLNKNQSEMIKKELYELFGEEEMQLKAIYDYSEIYDLVFKEDK